LTKAFFKKLWLRIFRRAEKYSDEPELRQSLRKILGFEPGELEWYKKAFTHPSFNLRDEKGNLYNFERLEFLGDAVLELATSDYLFRKFPARDEGKLTEIRAKIVSRKNLNRLGRQWQLRKFLPPTRKHRYGDNVEGNVLEALIGAVYMDKGYDTARDFILRKILRPQGDFSHLDKQISSYKGYMIAWAQRRHKRYQFLTDQEENKQGQTIYHTRFFLNGRLMAHGRAVSKKKAEEMAARNAYQRIFKK